MNYGYQDYTWGDLLTEVDGDHIEYDAIGNPVKIGHYDKSSDEWSDGYELTWNGRQLISYQYFEYYGEDDYYYGTTIEYTYNADGIRTSKTVDGIRHDYVLNGSQIISEIWKSGNTEYLLYYVYDETGLPIGLKYRTSAYEAGVFDCFFFEKNLQGDIIAVYNSTGKRIGSYTYDAWGNVTCKQSSGITTLERYVFQLYNPFRYRGYFYDYYSGWYYLQSRYYNPEWGRFLNADGFISTGTGMLGHNMFAYCNNNPVMFVDQEGDFPWLIIGLVALLASVTTMTACQTPPREETYHFESYDNYEDAYKAGMNKTFEAASEREFEYEYGCIIIQYPNDSKFYLSNCVTDKKLQMVTLPFPKNATAIADIHSHPWHKSEPFASDGRHPQDQFIVDIDKCGYILKGGRNIDQWETIEWYVGN